MAKVRAALIVLFSLLLLFPTYWMLAGSLQPISGVLRLPPNLVPRAVTVGNYVALFKHNPISRWALNTVALGGLSVIGAVGTAAVAGYAFSAFHMPVCIWWAFIVTLMVPRVAIVIPQFAVFHGLRLAGGWVGVFLPLLYYPTGILLFRVHADGMPKSLRDAARIDGASEGQIFTRIVLPLATPVIGILVIGKAFEALGDYLWQSLILTGREEMTLIVGLVAATGRRQEISVNPIGVTLAAGILMMAPMLVVFLVFQRSFRYNLLGGAIKE